MIQETFGLIKALIVYYFITPTTKNMKKNTFRCFLLVGFRQEMVNFIENLDTLISQRALWQ